MGQRANTAAIGGFVIGAVVLMVAGILIFGSGKLFTKTVKHVMFFEGSVKGLAVGAPVNLKGVRIGSVADISLLYDAMDVSFKIMVITEADPGKMMAISSKGTKRGHGGGEIPQGRETLDLLIEKGLRAQLAMQSLVTGQLCVNLDFFPDKPARLVGIEKKLAEVPTIPSGLEQLSRTVERLPLEEIADKFVATLEGIESFINSPDSKQILGNINSTVKEAKVVLQNINTRIDPITTDLGDALKQARSLLANMDRQVGPVATDVRETVREAKTLIKDVDKQVGPISAGLAETLKSTQRAVERAEKVMVALEGAVGQDSEVRYELTLAMKELSSTARSLRAFSDYLERHPESLVRGKGK